jgi:signal peptidase II
MKRQFAALLFIPFIIAADQLSKWAVMEKIIAPANDLARPSLGFFEWLVTGEKLDFTKVEVLPFFNWVMVWNKGISFGMLQSDTQAGVYMMMAFAVLISLFFLIWMFRTDNRLVIFAISLVVGGAIGNVIDRFRFGAVADFLDFHIGDMHWPAFNLADSCITLGIAFIIIDGLFFEPGRHKKAEAHDEI